MRWLARLLRRWWKSMIRVDRNHGDAAQARKDALERYQRAIARRPQVERTADTLETLIEQALRGG